jgi:predicted RNA binding protein YcfA (HicA-like mRNA interferase family)
MLAPVLAYDVDRAAMRRRMAQHQHSVSLAEARRVLEAYGWTLGRIRGSHYFFTRGALTLSVPYRRPHILAAYVRQILSVTGGQDDDDA